MAERIPYHRDPLVRRINAVLARSGERLRIPRGPADSHALGLYTVHLRTGVITGRHLDLQRLGDELQVLGDRRRRNNNV